MRIEDDSMWDCSVCTFKNAKEAFKCEVCDTRKGTSTRKPRLNTQVVELQQQIQKAILKEKGDETHKKKREHGPSHKKDSSFEEKQYSGRLPKLRNVDRSSARNYEITSNGVTVTITEFKPRWRTSSSSLSSHNHHQTSTVAPTGAPLHPASPSPSSCSSSMHGGLTSTPFLLTGEKTPPVPTSGGRGVAASPPNSLTGVPAALAASLPSPQRPGGGHHSHSFSHQHGGGVTSPDRSGSTVAMSESEHRESEEQDTSE